VGLKQPCESPRNQGGSPPRRSVLPIALDGRGCGVNCFLAVWDRDAEFAATYLANGWLVFINGRLNSRSLDG